MEQYFFQMTLASGLAVFTPATPASLEAETMFQYGDACQNLLDLSYEEIEALADPTNLGALDFFCSVEAQAECYELSLIVDELGALDPSPADGFCRFVPAAHRLEGLPEQLGNYGSNGAPASSEF